MNKNTFWRNNGKDFCTMHCIFSDSHKTYEEFFETHFLNPLVRRHTS